MKQAYIQLIGDAIIPLSGALFFDWSLYFILLFYCLDLLASEVIIHLKSKKTVEFRGMTTKRWFLNGLKSAGLLLLVITLMHVGVFFIQEGIDFTRDFREFIMYEELGVQQGYILIPLVAFSAYQLYRMTFLMPARYRTITMEEIWNPHFVSLFLMIGLSGLAIGLAQVVVFPEIAYVLSIVTLSSAYQLWKILK